MREAHITTDAAAEDINTPVHSECRRDGYVWFNTHSQSQSHTKKQTDRTWGAKAARTRGNLVSSSPVDEKLLRAFVTKFRQPGY